MDGASPTALLKFLLPKTPMLVKTALAHSLSVSENSSKWDLRTAMTVSVLRDILQPPPGSRQATISQQQRPTLRDPGVRGNMWIANTAFEPPPEDDAREALFSAIAALTPAGDPSPCPYDPPAHHRLTAEWTGYRAGAAKTDPPPPGMSDADKYASLLAEAPNAEALTVLYFHGGAYYMCDPATHRALTSDLARLTGGRLLSVRYRLSPQAAFPAALLDALHAYLSLLHPPPGSLHQPVPASTIVLAGDSAGGNLAVALLQLLLQLNRASPSTPPSLNFHGSRVPVPPPAGAAVSSPWLDLTRSMPSLSRNARYDYLPPAPPPGSRHLRIPTCELWPSPPPRADLFAEAGALVHPLVSPLAAPDWGNCPPVWCGLGEEMLADEGALWCKRLEGQGVRVRWEAFEALPHCFSMVLPGLPASKRFMEDWAGFVKEVVGVGGKVAGASEEGGKRKGVKTGGVTVKAKTLEVVESPVGGEMETTYEEAIALMRKTRDIICSVGGKEPQPML